jgi:hypothetical protein
MRLWENDSLEEQDSVREQQAEEMRLIASRYGAQREEFEEVYRDARFGVPVAAPSVAEKSDEHVCCSKCGSKDLSAQRKGFGAVKAVAGAVLLGGLGLLGGFVGSRDVIVTCLKCGNQWAAGEGEG